MLASSPPGCQYRAMPESKPGRARAKPAVRVLVVDDHRTFADALATALELERGIRVVGKATDAERAVRLAEEEHPDVILMDVRMPGTDGINATRTVKEAAPETRVLMLSAHEDENLVARSLDAGAEGFLSKGAAVKEVVAAVRAASRGENLLPPEEVRRLLANLRRRRDQDATGQARVERLTPRETQILQRMADGLSPEAIAEEMGISRHTLRTHVQNILFKLKVHSKLEALAEAIRYGKVRIRQPV
jgi:DNA-binding NarL/FixJ family response regulator